MTQIQKGLAYCIVFIVLILSGYGQDQSISDDIYKDPSKINNALENNPKTVDYSKIDFSIQGLDYSLLDYNKIPADKFNQLDVSKISYPKLFSDIGRSDLSINLNNYNPKLEKSSNGDIIAVHPSHPSQYVNIKKVPTDALLEVKENEILVVLRSETKNIDLSGIGSGTVYSIGKNQLSNGMEFSGLLSFDGERSYLREGRSLEIDYANFVHALKGDVSIYYGVENFQPDQHKSESYFFTDKDKLIIKAVSDESVEFGIRENHQIFKTDSKDNLKIKVSNGDRIDVESRNEQNKIPFLKHYSSDNGESIMENDRLTFKLAKGTFGITTPDDYDPDFYKKKSQSVAVQVGSDSIDEEIRISSADQFAVLQDNSKETVVFNKFGLPISDSIEENSLQTIEDLKKRYPDKKFGINRLPYIGAQEDYTEESASPLAVQLADHFLRNNKKTNLFTEIEFTDAPQSKAIPNGMIIGEPTIYPYLQPEIRERAFRNVMPLDILVHESTHTEDISIFDEETKQYSGSVLETERLQNFYNSVGEDAMQKLRADSQFKQVIESLRNKLAISDSTDDILNDPLKFATFVRGSLTSGLGGKSASLGDFDLMENDFQRVTKLPSVHALNPAAKNFRVFIENSNLAATLANTKPDNSQIQYLEISALYGEQSVETRKARANSADKELSDLYRKLTQLAFDSGKITQQDCSTITGSSCQKCVLYKLTCKQ